MNPTTGFFMLLCIHSAADSPRAADFTDHHHRLSLRIVIEQLEHVDVQFRPLTGSPPMPTAYLTEPASVSCATASYVNVPSDDHADAARLWI